MKDSSPALKPENLPTTNRKILRAVTVVAFFSGFATLATVVKELLVAKWFGRIDALDAFLIAFLVPSFLAELVAGSFNVALIPTFIQVREADGPEAAHRLFSSVLLGSLGLLVAVSILLGFLAPYYLPLLGSGFGAAKLVLTRRLLYVLLPFIAVKGLAANWSAVLNASERFAWTALSPMLTPLVAIVFLVLRGRAWGVFALALGTVAGQTTEAGLLGWVAKTEGVRLKPEWYGMGPHVRQVLAQYLPLLAGAFVASSTNLVDQSMAAMLAPGSVAALNYGKKMVGGVLGIGAFALGTAVLPYFSQLTAQQDWEGCRHTLRTYSRLVILVSVPLSLGISLFSPLLVRAVFQRGAFTAQDTGVVSSVQTFLALQIPFYILGIMGVRMISALKRNVQLILVSAFTLVLDVALNYLFMRYLGVSGIALSSSVVSVAGCIATYLLIFPAIGSMYGRGSSGGNRTL